MISLYQPPWPVRPVSEKSWIFYRNVSKAGEESCFSFFTRGETDVDVLQSLCVVHVRKTSAKSHSVK